MGNSEENTNNENFFRHCSEEHNEQEREARNSIFIKLWPYTFAFRLRIRPAVRQTPPPLILPFSGVPMLVNHFWKTTPISGRAIIFKSPFSQVLRGFVFSYFTPFFSSLRKIYLISGLTGCSGIKQTYSVSRIIGQETERDSAAQETAEFNPRCY